MTTLLVSKALDEIGRIPVCFYFPALGDSAAFWLVASNAPHSVSWKQQDRHFPWPRGRFLSPSNIPVLLAGTEAGNAKLSSQAQLSQDGKYISSNFTYLFYFFFLSFFFFCKGSIFRNYPRVKIQYRDLIWKVIPIKTKQEKKHKTYHWNKGCKHNAWPDSV